MEVHVSKKTMQVHGHASSSRNAVSLAKESMQVPVHLPEEIIYNILLRIPAEFLISLKAICKLWFDIISDRKFVDTHLSHHQLDFHYVVVSKHTPIGTPRFWIYENELINLNDMENTKIQLQEQQLQGLLKDRIHFVSSYGGLLLFISSTREQLYVCNPVTRKCSVLPTPCSDFHVHQATYWSLFRDDSIQKFMVVGFSTSLPRRCFVYIPHSNTTNWKNFEPPHQPYCVQTKPIFINKELHWLAICFDQPKLFICSLEVAEEKCIETQVPFLPEVQWCLNYIIELNGSICVTDCCWNNNHLDIWTLLNREKCIWSKSSRINIPSVLAFDWDIPVSIFHYSNQTKIVTSKAGKMVFTYDFKNKDWKTFTHPVKDGVLVWEVSAHINSLVKFE